MEGEIKEDQNPGGDGLNSDSLALGVRDWTHCAQDRQTWRDILQQALTRYWLYSAT
jgi:hypothetical protein